MLSIESTMNSLPTLRVEYLPTAIAGDAATIHLAVRPADLERGCELWIRGTENGPYQRLLNPTAALAVVWQGDLQLLELVCFCPESRQFLVCREYLRRHPTTEIRVQATDHAVTYVAQPETTTDLWERQDLPGHAGGWHPLHLPQAEFACQQEVRHGLLSLENGSAQAAKHVALAFDPELTVGRLHRGPERRLNQSSRGAHWHLGWQRVTAASESRSRTVTSDLMERTRDWMSRSAGTLRLASTGERLALEAVSSSLPEEFLLHQRGGSTWDLELTWNTYSDHLRIYAEEASGQIAGQRVQLPWFWAARCQVVPELEDRFYLWLPGWLQHFPDLIGLGGWVGSEIRWFVEDGRLVLVDAGGVNQRS